MPKVPLPQGDGKFVTWPADEGVLGVVGVAPWATLDFCRCFYSLVAATKDWHYPRVLLDINTKLPSRGRYLQLSEVDPSPYIAETIRELAENGATVAVVACNTAHILFDRWASCSPIPIINIIDATVEQAHKVGTRSALALTSDSLHAYDLYGKAAEKEGILFHRLPSEFQIVVNRLIEQVKVEGTISQNGRHDFLRLLTYCSSIGVDSIFLGCTELSILAVDFKNANFRVVDSNLALANAAYSAIQK